MLIHARLSVTDLVTHIQKINFISGPIFVILDALEFSGLID